MSLNKILIEVDMFGSSYARPGLDQRNDLGYGINKNKNFNPRSMGNCYPFDCDEEDLSEIEIDEESIDSILSKTLKFKKNDFYKKKSNNPFYFAAGNTKLSDCFWKTDKVLLEINALGDSMSPITMKGVGSGLTSASTKYPHGSEHYFRPGAKAGWYSPAPESELFWDPENDEYDSPVFDIDDLINKVKKIRGF
jgi:hypothetical protein